MKTSRAQQSTSTEAGTTFGRLSPMRRRAAAAAGLAGLAAIVVGGAAAADEAKPGDYLYEVDRALEDLGINDGGAEERLEETEELIEEGDVEGALESADEAVEEMDEDAELDEEDLEELTGLLHAAESVLKNGSEQSLERRTQVAEMLTFMATTDLKGKEFGQAVSQHARGIWVDPEAEEDVVDEDASEEELVEGAEAAEGDDLTEVSDKAELKELKKAAKDAAKDAKAEAKELKKAAKGAVKDAKANAKGNKNK
ncbi:hypothetical protein [Demequina zhanjiangensis]|uniref:DUF5667 domain-containing protein n=1 Tax=Demequina zhanjiangensis TaxID=3051659 RepID=A0ABT8G3Y5_9MICO|nr:hypothetical protein [Demequina sp. SYSU T00b26]MDN4473808.1 hypothetical protein [Demequina sp. SYSU T00b26]